MLTNLIALYKAFRIGFGGCVCSAGSLRKKQQKWLV